MNAILCCILKYKLEHCLNALDEAGELARQLFCRNLEEEIEYFLSLDELLEDYWML